MKMELALITIGVEKKIDKETNKSLFDSLHFEYIQELHNIPHQPPSTTWIAFKRAQKDFAQQIEASLLASFDKELKALCNKLNFELPNSLKDIAITFSPSKVKVAYMELREEKTGAFIIHYKSDPITLIMNLMNGDLLCVLGNKVEEINTNKEVDTFIVKLSEGININSFQVP